MKAKISEVFDSIQGEGLYLGERQIFVRFFGCNLNCKFCDTQLHHFSEYDPQELLDEVKLYQDNYHSISFTGGEPLLQKDFLKEALKLTRASGFKNYLETNGTLHSELGEVINYLDIIAMDIKLPSSTGGEQLWDEHRKFLEIARRKQVFCKAIICKETKEEDIIEALGLIKNIHKFAVLVLQPNSFDDERAISEKLRDYKDICRREKVTACVIPQIHKKIGLK